MKKLLCFALLTTMIVGCSSKEKENDKVGVNSNYIFEMLANVDNDKMVEEKDADKDTTDKDNKDDNNDVNEEGGIKSDDKKSGQTSGVSPSGGNGSSQESPATPTPPKEEKPTQPVETPPPADPTPAPPTNQQAMAQQVFVKINEYRVQNGKTPFAWAGNLQTRSENHALAMATREALWHSGAVECISNYDDPFSSWVNSSAHNEILLCNNTAAAVGIYYYNGYYYSVFQCRYQ